MTSIVKTLHPRGLLDIPKFVPPNMAYETVGGSTALGIAGDDGDWDLYGFCIPPKEMVFPHLAGEIPGFGTQIKRFQSYDQKHVWDPNALGGKGREYDFAIYNIVRFFQLTMDGNPNMITTLYTPEQCVLFASEAGRMVRDNRDLFLSKLCWQKFRGFSIGQISRMTGTDDGDKDSPAEAKQRRSSKRQKLIDEFGYDCKFGYNVIRALNEVEQILAEGTLDLQRHNEQLKSIRRGEWPIQEIVDTHKRRLVELEALAATSALPAKPDEVKLKQLLLDCLESHYGSLKGVHVKPDHHDRAFAEIIEIAEMARRR